MEQVKVSIVMPILNSMPFFETALMSVLGQSMREIEVIVVDGGSTDGTLEYIREQTTKDSRIKLLHSEKKSMGYQYNLGIQNAVGDFIGFCEGDDYLDEEMIEKLYETAITNKEIDFVKSDFYMFIGKEESEFSIKYGVLSKDYKDFYRKEMNLKSMPELFFRDINMWNGIYRKDFLEKNEIYLNETPGAAFQDIDFTQQTLLSAEKIVYITNACYHYRRDNEGSSVYKDTAVYALQELNYMLHFMETHKELKDTFGELMLDRLFILFCDRYGKKLYENSSNAFVERLEELQTALRNYIDSLPNGNRGHVLNTKLINFFIEDFDLFSSVCRKKYECERKEWIHFRDVIGKMNELVIFGAGELGQSYLAFMVRNHMEKTIIFCDNNPVLWGTYILQDYPVLSVEDAAKKYPNTFFLVSNRKYFFEAKGQLMTYGVHGGKILEGPVLSPHSSMEMDLQSLKD